MSHCTHTYWQLITHTNKLHCAHCYNWRLRIWLIFTFVVRLHLKKFRVFRICFINTCIVLILGVVNHKNKIYHMFAHTSDLVRKVKNWSKSSEYWVTWHLGQTHHYIVRSAKKWSNSHLKPMEISTIFRISVPNGSIYSENPVPQYSHQIRTGHLAIFLSTSTQKIWKLIFPKTYLKRLGLKFSLLVRLQKNRWLSLCCPC